MEHSKEDIEAVKKLDQLYECKFDIDKAKEYYNNHKNDFCIIKSNDHNGFNTFVGNAFCHLIDMAIENRNDVSGLKNLIKMREEMQFFQDDKEYIKELEKFINRL